jgi:hypothetical protein
VGAELFYAEGRTYIQTDRHTIEDYIRKCSVKFTIEQAVKTERKDV